MKILIVEDEKDLAAILKDGSKNGFTADLSFDGRRICLAGINTLGTPQRHLRGVPSLLKNQQVWYENSI